MDLPIVEEPPNGYERGQEIAPFKYHPTEVGWIEFTAAELANYLRGLRTAVVLVRKEGPFPSNHSQGNPDGTLTSYPDFPYIYEVWYKPLPKQPSALDRAFQEHFPRGF